MMKKFFILIQLKNLIDAYKDSIDSHLQNHSYNKITIIGVSEGGLLLPKLYNALSTRDQIDSLIIIGAGGLSQYDCFKIQSESKEHFPDGYKNELDKLEIEYDKILQNPYSITQRFMGWPYSRWSSFFNYTPLNYIKEIEIPMLYIQGKKDKSSPIESVIAIENLSFDNIEIHYLPDMEHVPLEEYETIEVFNLIDDWLQKLN